MVTNTNYAFCIENIFFGSIYTLTPLKTQQCSVFIQSQICSERKILKQWHEHDYVPVCDSHYVVIKDLT